MARIEYPAIVAYFRDDHLLMDVAEGTRERFRKTNLDAYTPYPVHGLEHALGLKRSWIADAVRVILVTGWGLGLYFQYWTSAVDWATNIGGKPFFSWPAFVPVTFEAGVLMAGISNLILVLATCRLFPRPKTLVLDPELTDNKFALVVPIGRNEDESKIAEYLVEKGAQDLVVVEGADHEAGEYQLRPVAMPLMKGGAAHGFAHAH
ncbi:MAG: DUF3341 domain-containing protein [Candidatus Sumerlaeia bacterium]|nr:DUF3341 domain-containing protein [Candidatus Sumerlaeia bacterium]